MPRRLFQHSPNPGPDIVRIDCFTDTSIYAEDVFANRIVSQTQPRNINRDDAFSDVYTALIAAVSRMTRDQGKITLLLSGGIQSSLIAMAMVEAGIKFRTLTYSRQNSQSEGSMVELDNARRLSYVCGVEHEHLALSDEDIVTSASIASGSLNFIPNVSMLYDCAFWNLVSRSLPQGTCVAGGFLYDVIGSDVARYSPDVRKESQLNKEVDSHIASSNRFTRSKSASMLSQFESSRSLSLLFPFASREVFDAGAQIVAPTLSRMGPENRVGIGRVIDGKYRDCMDIGERICPGDSLEYPSVIMDDAARSLKMKMTPEQMVQCLHILRSRDSTLIPSMHGR